MKLRAASWLSLSALCACNAVLGIEELQVRGDAGSDTVAQQRADAGAKDAASAAGSGADAGRTPAADPRDAGTRPTSAADSGMTQPAAAGGDAPRAGDSAPAPAGAAAEQTSPVTGTVIDFRGLKVPGVSVRVGTEQTTTDDAGKFTLPAVPQRYDITLHIQTTVNNGAASFVWQFQGLTRRDPTLQVYRGLPERSGYLALNAQNLTFPLPMGQSITYGWSSPEGDSRYQDAVTEGVTQLSFVWSGATMTSGTIHALLISETDGLPSDYLAYDTQSLAITADTMTEIGFDLGTAKPSNDVVRGTVTGLAEERRNELYLRFPDDNTSLPLIDQWDAEDSFTYTVPSLPGATLTVVAKNVVNPGGMAAAYAEIEPGADANLALPALPILVGPEQDKTGVDGTTLFQWNGEPRVYVLWANSVTDNDKIYVVTRDNQARFPIGAEYGYTPRAGAQFVWSLEVHDNYASVDEATSEAGFLSAYADDTIRGPRRGDGTFVRSQARNFWTPP
jgi:hypothetical protein